MKRIKAMLSTKVLLTALILSLLMLGATTYAVAGKVEAKGYLGVNIERLSTEDKEEFGVTFGLLVVKLVEDEAAAKAGIKKYDVIQYFNGEKMHRADDLVEAVRALKPGDKVKIKLVRDKKNMDVTVTLGEYKFKDLWTRSKGDKNVFVFSGSRGFLGVHLQKLNKDLAGYFGVNEDEGALVTSVEKDGPAQKAGLKSGDVIVEIGEKKVKGPEEVRKALTESKKGDKVQVTVVRHKKKQSINVELGEAFGRHNFKIFKGCGKDGVFSIKIPDFHIDVPHFEHKFIWNEERQKEMEEELKKVEKKMEGVGEKIQKKLKYLEEYTYI